MLVNDLPAAKLNPLAGLREKLPDTFSFLRGPRSVETGGRITADISKLEQTASALLKEDRLSVRFCYARLSALARNEFSGRQVSIAVKSIGLVPELAPKELSTEFPKEAYNPLNNPSTLLLKKQDIQKVSDIVHALAEQIGCDVNFSEGSFATRWTNQLSVPYPSREIGFISREKLLRYQDQEAGYTTCSFMLTPKNLSAVYSTKNAGLIADFWSEVLQDQIKRQILQGALADIEKIANQAGTEYVSGIKAQIDKSKHEQETKLKIEQNAIKTVQDNKLSELMRPWSVGVFSEKTTFEFSKLSLTAEKASQGQLSGAEKVNSIAQSFGKDLFDRVNSIPELQGKFRVSADFAYTAEESFMSDYEDIYFGNRRRNASLYVSINNEEISGIPPAAFDKLKDVLQGFIADYYK